MDADLVSAFVLLDLNSVFDTVDHEMLIDVLKNTFSIEQHELEWFCSYHTRCSQTFNMPDNSSGPVSRMCSLLQGSRIGPQKFTVYRQKTATLVDLTVFLLL